MKLGYSAWAMPRLPVAEQIAIVRRSGYAGIELVSGPQGSLDALTIDAAGRKAIRRLLDDAGLALPSIAAHGNLLERDPEKRAAAKARVEAGIDLAADLAGDDGPPCVVTMAYGKPDEYEEVRERIAEGCLELARYGAARGVTVALEPHVGQAVDLPEKVIWLMDRVDSPHYRLNFDNSHFEVMGRGVDDYVPLLTPYAVHTHLKDQRGISPKHEFLPPGEGDFDYVRYLQAMEAAGYGGFVTVEISVMVQRRPDYDPEAVARRSFEVLTDASRRAGVPLETGEAGRTAGAAR
jgi:sugar phosphate isomerase/epimerase